MQTSHGVGRFGTRSRNGENVQDRCQFCDFQAGYKVDIKAALISHRRTCAGFIAKQSQERKDNTERENKFKKELLKQAQDKFRNTQRIHNPDYIEFVNTTRVQDSYDDDDDNNFQGNEELLSVPNVQYVQGIRELEREYFSDKQNDNIQTRQSHFNEDDQDFLQKQDKGFKFGHCNGKDFVRLANLTGLLQSSEASGNAIFETLNDIMRDHKIQFRFMSWTTVLTAMKKNATYFHPVDDKVYEFNKDIWGEHVHTWRGQLSSGTLLLKNARISQPHGVLINIVKQIAECTLSVLNPSTFQSLPLDKVNGKRPNSFFGGVVYEEFYKKFDEERAPYALPKLETDKRIFTKDVNGVVFENVMICITFFEDELAVQKNKHYGAEPLIIQILNIVEQDNICLLGFPPQIQDSFEVLDSYLKEVQKCPTQKFREKIINLTKRDIKDRY